MSPFSYRKKSLQFFLYFSVPFDFTAFLHQDDKIERSFDAILVKPEEFPQVSFDSIPVGRPPDLLLHHNAETMKRIFILLRKKDEASGGISFS